MDTPARFDNAHQVESYFGLVPSERSSGEKQRKGRITKVGNARVRWLLVQVAISMMRLSSPDTAHLRAWAERTPLHRSHHYPSLAGEGRLDAQRLHGKKPVGAGRTRRTSHGCGNSPSGRTGDDHLSTK